MIVSSTSPGRGAETCDFLLASLRTAPCVMHVCRVWHRCQDGYGDMEFFCTAAGHALDVAVTEKKHSLSTSSHLDHVCVCGVGAGIHSLGLSRRKKNCVSVNLRLHKNKHTQQWKNTTQKNLQKVETKF